MGVRGKTVAVLGGDRRMYEVITYFLRAGAQVQIAGLSWDTRGDGAQVCPSAAEALKGAQVAVLPVQGVSEEGRVFSLPGAPICHIDTDALRRMDRERVVFAGIGNTYLRSACAAASAPLIEYREADEFAIWNSIPSAEGAIQMAMEATPFTLFGSRSLIIGFGRTGKAIALLMRGLFSSVSVVAKTEMDIAKAWASGYQAHPWEEFRRAVAESDLIFNTVPALVLPREVLHEAPKHAVIIDVASAPGGTDFEAAAELGIIAKLAPGLPGLVAPVTAGKIIAELIVRHLTSHVVEEEP
jgi:dipicolinate synthase subunit A